MQTIFHNKHAKEDNKFVYTLTNEATSERRYFLIDKRRNGQVLAEDITLEMIEKTKERPMSSQDAISVLQELIKELAEGNQYKPEYWWR